MSTLTDTASGARFWEDIDPATREDLDQQFLRELSTWDIRGLTDEGVRAYLDYRHERPNAAITTYEEGQIRRMLRRYRDPTLVPDPVDQETHVDALEKFGATRLHQTNMETFWVVMAAALVIIAVVGTAALFFFNG